MKDVLNFTHSIKFTIRKVVKMKRWCSVLFDRAAKVWVPVCAVTLLAACGGGGSSLLPTPSLDPPPIETPEGDSSDETPEGDSSDETPEGDSSDETPEADSSDTSSGPPVNSPPVNPPPASPPPVSSTPPASRTSGTTGPYWTTWTGNQKQIEQVVRAGFQGVRRVPGPLSGDTLATDLGPWRQGYFAFGLIEIEDEDGNDTVTALAFGNASGSNPRAMPGKTLTWSGGAVAHTIGATDDRMTGNVRVDFDWEAETVDVNIELDYDAMLGEHTKNVGWIDVDVSDGDGTFKQRHKHAAGDNFLAGSFFGPKHEEVGGVFEAGELGVLGAFGGTRQ